MFNTDVNGRGIDRKKLPDLNGSDGCYDHNSEEDGVLVLGSPNRSVDETSEPLTQEVAEDSRVAVAARRDPAIPLHFCTPSATEDADCAVVVVQVGRSRMTD